MEIKIPGEACPICRKPARDDFKPFCSARCADIDLGRWLSDRYVIPADDEEDVDGPPSDIERPA
jgi:hypothetical protein